MARAKAPPSVAQNNVSRNVANTPSAQSAKSTTKRRSESAPRRLRATSSAASGQREHERQVEVVERLGRLVRREAEDEAAGERRPRARAAARGRGGRRTRPRARGRRGRARRRSRPARSQPSAARPAAPGPGSSSSTRGSSRRARRRGSSAADGGRARSHAATTRATTRSSPDRHRTTRRRRRCAAPRGRRAPARAARSPRGRRVGRYSPEPKRRFARSATTDPSERSRRDGVAGLGLLATGEQRLHVLRHLADHAACDVLHDAAAHLRHPSGDQHVGGDRHVRSALAARRRPS